MGLDAVERYGIVDGEKVEEHIWRALDLVEKPKKEETPSQLAILGRYVLEPEIFSILENVPRGRGGEIQLTDALKVLAKQQAVYAYEFSGRRYDIGDKEGFLEATVEMALARPDLREEFLAYLRQLSDLK